MDPLCKCGQVPAAAAVSLGAGPAPSHTEGSAPVDFAELKTSVRRQKREICCMCQGAVLHSEWGGVVHGGVGWCGVVWVGVWWGGVVLVAAAAVLHLDGGGLVDRALRFTWAWRCINPLPLGSVLAAETLEMVAKAVPEDVVEVAAPSGTRFGCCRLALL